MAIKLPKMSARVMRILRPTTKLGRVTCWLGGICLLLWLASATSGSRLEGWAIFTTLVFLPFAAVVVFRWIYRPLLWRLRNRLIVTYLFIGVMPILLLLLMGALAGTLFGGQFATYVAISDLHSELQHLQAANDALAAQLFPLEGSGKLNEQIAEQFTRASDERFPGRTVTLSRNEKGFVLSTEGALLATRPAQVPEFINGDFTGFVVDQDVLHLRAIKLDRDGDRRIALISDIPITPNLLLPTAARLGTVTLAPPERKGDIQYPLSPDTRMPVKAGQLPPRSHWFDVALHFGTLFDVVDWQTGKKPEYGIIDVATRPSMLYATLFATLGDKALIVRDLLFAIAIFFGVIELAALYIGIRLSRSMTASVADLYLATEHVNRGDLSHRIQLRGRDQMAALEESFNSMTESLAKLMGEQKEKQRLENELSIAYEVQELLFPHKVTDLPSLEVHGVCVPARTVSGDYYDFIPLGTDRLVLAVGDISGKGISAALLMATVHAFVRAYSLEPEMVLMPAVFEYQAQSQGDSRMYYRGDGGSESQLAPAMLMTTLNYQLYRSTPEAKYATMFLGCYDAKARILTYCNAGHLPPIILRATGEVFRLDINGTVVGLFDGVTYDESTIVMQPGDIFVAYSDGVSEPENEFGEFGEERLIELILEHRHKPLPRITEIITGAVADWIGSAEQPDDVTIVLARCTPAFAARA
jgi:sigma-B regulation protein RsbU (phosphoserine phosphatase)